MARCGDWQRLRTVWHDDGRMMATWFQGSADGFLEANRQAWARGVRILHLWPPGGAAGAGAVIPGSEA